MDYLYWLLIIPALLLHGIMWEVTAKVSVLAGIKDDSGSERFCGFFWPVTLPVMVGMLLVRIWVKAGYYRIRNLYFRVLEWFKTKPKRPDQGPYRENHATAQVGHPE
jgi:hypothetical protein